MIQYKLKLEESTLKVLRDFKVEQLVCKIQNEESDLTEFYWDYAANAYLTVETGFDNCLSDNLNVEEIDYV